MHRSATDNEERKNRKKLKWYKGKNCLNKKISANKRVKMHEKMWLRKKILNLRQEGNIIGKS